MKLLAFGDSFVEGLVKEPSENTPKERDEICFARKIVNKSKYITSYENFGKRGSGNLSISHNVYKYVQNNDCKNSFFLICWSGLDRYEEYYKETNQYQNTDYKKQKHDPLFQTNILASGIHNYLKNRKISHLFTSSFTPFYQFHDKNIMSEKYIIGDATKANSLFDIISNRFNSNTKPFGEYLASHAQFNVPKSKFIAGCLHPTDKGHTKIAETLVPYIDNFIQLKTS